MSQINPGSPPCSQSQLPTPNPNSQSQRKATVFRAMARQDNSTKRTRTLSMPQQKARSQPPLQVASSVNDGLKKTAYRKSGQHACRATAVETAG